MKIKSVILTIAIIILTIFVTFYGINTVYPTPKYEDYCNSSSIGKIIQTSQECEQEGGKWTNYEVVDPKQQITGYCDLDYQCRQDYDTAREIRSRKVFLIALPLGIIIILTGLFFFNIETAGAGLMGGGVGTLIYGAGAYWPYSENLMRFIISLIGLMAVILISYYLEKKLTNKKISLSKIFKK
jgi:hypothetical protein